MAFSMGIMDIFLSPTSPVFAALQA